MKTAETIKLSGEVEIPPDRQSLTIIFDGAYPHLYGEAHERIEDDIARLLSKKYPFSGRIESGITGNTTKFGCKEEKWQAEG